jgi:type I restriction enzyme M protein
MTKRGRINRTLESEMWRACDILRRDNNIGGVMQYTEHLAWLLFLKFLDVEEKKRAEMAAFKGEPYEPVLHGELAWDRWASPRALEKWNSDDGELVRFVRGTLLPGLVGLTGSPLARTIARMFSDEGSGDQNVLRTIPVCSSDYNLKDVIEIINAIHFDRDDDVFTITDFYEQLLARMGAESGTGGEFHTPRPVIRFMVDVIDPQIGETVYDPACGSAGFLAQAYLHMEDKAKTVEDREFLQHHAFHGQEKKAIAALLGTMNIVLHGVTDPNILRINTLEENVKTSVVKRYDVVLTNPPFGGTEGRNIQSNFPVKNNATELLFLQHILKKLKKTPNARAAVVVPEGTLFRGGAFAEVKRGLLEDFHLFAVVSLPSGTFAPYSDVKTALLFFQRPDKVLHTNPKARQETWYYEMALPEGLQKFSKGNPIQDEHFTEARQMWKQWQSYILGESEMPFLYAADIRDRWQAHYLWEDYRSDQAECAQLEPPSHPDDGSSVYWDAYYIARKRCEKLKPPVLADGLSPAYQEAFHAKGPQPPTPFTTWVELIDGLKENVYDISARNPNRDERLDLPYPEKLTVQLFENYSVLQDKIRRVSKDLYIQNKNGGNKNG